jgi:8-oxo-dGTP diphosphatase
VREWLVGSALIESPDGLLLVANRRRDGAIDWSPPGGVIDAGETFLDGLTREVEEETGLRVTSWSGPVYRLRAEADDAGWTLNVEVRRALGVEGSMRVEDPDGIVVDARFVPVEECTAILASTWQLLHEPLGAWLLERWEDERAFHYRLAGSERAAMTVTRLA